MDSVVVSDFLKVPHVFDFRFVVRVFSGVSEWVVGAVKCPGSDFRDFCEVYESPVDY